MFARAKAERSSTKGQVQKRVRPKRTEENLGFNSKGRSLLQLQRAHGNQTVQRLVNEEVQPKLEIRQPGDKYEREADRMTEQVMRTGECKPRLKGRLQRTAAAPGLEDVPPIISNVLESRGQRLDPATRSHMEDRFGRRFNHVRVHSDGKAAESAQAINARAFTVGQDVVFGKGEYAPGSTSGRRLLAHELTHVVQQSEGGKPIVQRWTYGSGTPPHSDYTLVLKDDRPRVDRALKIVERIANNPKRYPRCHQRFQSLCDKPNPNELNHRLSNAVVWEDTDVTVFGSSVSPNHIAYENEAWRWGRWMLASTFLHELMHNCGHDNEDDIRKTERVCGLPERPT